MLDITVTATTTLRLGLPELLGVALVPLASWGVWKTRHVLAQVMAALHRQILPRSLQKAAQRLSGLQRPLMLPEVQKLPERPS